MRAALVALALLRLGLRLEAGPEYDSNAHHVEHPGHPDDPSPVSSFLVRTTARGRLVLTTARSALRLSLDLGGKVFFARAAEAQDVFVARLQGEARTEVGRASLALNLDYHDAYQWNDTCGPLVIRDPLGETHAENNWCHRDFRLGALRASATVRDGVPSVTFEAGVRGYQWKPDDALSFVGVGGAIVPAARWRVGRDRDHELTASMTGRLEWRGFAGPALASAGDLGADPSAPRRRDLVATAAVQLAYLGSIHAVAGWSIEVDRSTSATASYLYQSLLLELAVPLPRRFTLAARAQLLFFSRGFVQRSLAVEDENRNAVMGELARDFDHGFTLRARYNLFRSAPADTVAGYDRHVGLVLLTWQR